MRTGRFNTRSLGDDEWYTPPHIFRALGIRYHLDPCAPPKPLAPWIPAETRLTFQDDGLRQEWRGRVWMNPPYGREVGYWMEKLAHHGNGVALTFSRTDTKWWQEWASQADAICFIKGRMKFIPGPNTKLGNNAGAPSALLGYGERCARAVEECGLGMVVYPS